mmetsp:Transcript_3624/g.9060  ORF Transcript_3624/g.9060 Transcript_3624/m.9060 type:complete len:236 (+) Transcript_3624:374-1081(+)
MAGWGCLRSAVQHLSGVGHVVGDVLAQGVRQVGLQVVQGGVAGHQRLHAEADEGGHGQAAVLDLVHGVLGGVQADGVEGEGVDEAGGAGLLEALVALGLQEAHHQEEDGELSNDGQVVLSAASLVPLDGHASQLSAQDADHGHHGPAAVGLLGLHEPLQPLGVLAQAQRVEAAVAGQSAVQVSGGLGIGQPQGARGGGLDLHRAARHGSRAHATQGRLSEQRGHFAKVVRRPPLT